MSANTDIKGIYEWPIRPMPSPWLFLTQKYAGSFWIALAYTKCAQTPLSLPIPLVTVLPRDWNDLAMQFLDNCDVAPRYGRVLFVMEDFEDSGALAGIQFATGWTPIMDEHAGQGRTINMLVPEDAVLVEHPDMQEMRRAFIDALNMAFKACKEIKES